MYLSFADMVASGSIHHAAEGLRNALHSAIRQFMSRVPAPDTPMQMPHIFKPLVLL